jgi:transposase-like protein
MIPALERWTGDHAMTKDTTKAAAVAADIMLFDNWFDSIEGGVRERVRGFIETMLEEELDGALCRPRYGRHKANGNEKAATLLVGCRHGHRKRALTGTFGKTEIAVPRARLMGDNGKTREWKSQSLPAYQRRTKAADALIAGAYLAGTNTRRVRRALKAVFAGEVGKDVVSRTWRKVKGDWDAWNARSLTDEPIIRLILDGTVVRVRLDKKARRFRSLSRSVCGRTAKRCCLRSRTWAARARPPGERCSTTSSSAG